MEVSNISIERFAAFLDGNLSEADMQTVATAIDADKSLSDILGTAIEVDDEAELLIAQTDAWQEDILNMDFDLPEIPVTLHEVGDNVELLANNTSAAHITAVADDEAIHLTTAEETSVGENGLDTESMTGHIELSHMEMEDTFLDTPVHEGNDLIDLGEDLA